jgi:hypothetical protein
MSTSTIEALASAGKLPRKRNSPLTTGDCHTTSASG